MDQMYIHKTILYVNVYIYIHVHMFDMSLLGYFLSESKDLRRA